MNIMKATVKTRIKSILRLFVLTPIVGVVFMILYGLSQGAVFYLDDNQTLLGGEVAGVCALLIVGFYAIYRRLLDRNWPCDLAPKAILSDTAKGLATGFGYFCVVTALLTIFGCYKIEALNADWKGLLRALGLFFLVAVAEEVIFRGIFFRELDRRFGPVVALVISGLIFGFIHMGNPGSTVWSSVAISVEAGLLLGAAYKYSGTLWLPIGIHWAWNYTQGNIFGFAVSGTLGGASLFDSTVSGPDIITGGVFGPEASIVSFILGIAATAVFIVLYIRRPAVLREACCVNAAEALAAKRAGADRIELCENLEVGGVTPSAENIVETVACGLPVNVLVRPRGGDFVYTAEEVEAMRVSIWLCADLGAEGVVIGALTSDGAVDVAAVKSLVEYAHSKGLTVTFHRAFDECADPSKALEDIIAIGCDRLLTSGQKPTAMKGRKLIASLVRQAGDRIIVMPGAGVTRSNLDELRFATGASEFHGTKICKRI